MTDQFPPQSGGPQPNPGQPPYGEPGPWQGPPPGNPQQYGPPPQQPPQQYGPPPQQPPQYGQQPPQYGQQPPQYGQQPPQYGQQPPYGQVPYPPQQPTYDGPPPMAPGGPVPPGPDYLSGLNAPPRRRRRGLIIASAAVVVALGVSGGAYAILAGNQSGKGKADVAAKYIPRDSIAAVSANLSPGGSETVEVLKFFRKFPEIAAHSSGNTISDGLLKPLFDGAPGVDYNTDIKPWLGSHISMAAEPQHGAMHPVAAIEVKNEDKAKTALGKYLRGQDDVGWVLHDGYAIISDSTADAQYAASHIGGSGLKGSGNYSSDVKDVPSDSVLNAWIDIKASLRYSENQHIVPSNVPVANLPDRMAIGLRFEDSTADLIYRVVGGKVTQSKTLMGPKVGALPNDTSFAMGITDGNTILANVWPSLQQFINQTNPYALQQFQDQTGLSMPGDLETLAGSRTIVAVGQNTNNVGFESTADPDKAAAVANKINEHSDQPAVIRKTNDGVLVASNPSWATAMQNGGSLGQQDAFKRAVPDADKANIVMYGDITKLTGSESSRLPADARAFESFGLTVTADSNGATAHLRLVLK